MQLPFSEPEPTPASAASSPAPPTKTSADQSVTAIVPAGTLVLPLPQFAPHIPDDPTPANEDEAEAWVREMCRHVRAWRRNLMRLTRDSDHGELKQELAKMYAKNKDTQASNFIQRHFRRPDAPADAKPFPIRVELFYISVCTCVAAIILLVLLMSR
jgi:hypothetical protein